MAERDLESYRRKGPSASTRDLLTVVRGAGVRGSTVLDVGGGIGAVVHELLGAGGTSATLVDASPAYLGAARSEAERRGMGDRVTFRAGDFTALAQEIPTADVVTLDKVVCCYPDMHRLLSAAAGRTTRLLGMVYPRDSWWVRAAMAVVNALFLVRRTTFRVYVFRNAAIEQVVADAGLVPRYRKRGFTWVVALYERRPR
ncbi:MAG: class I SAM-dependent methyltransferase [Gemmatimonadota bacterium]